MWGLCLNHLNSPTALAMGSLPIYAPGRFRGGFSGAGSGRFWGRFRTTRSAGQGCGTRFWEGSEARRFRGRWFRAEFQGSVPGQPPVWFLNFFSIDVPAELEKDVRADFLCLHCSPNAGVTPGLIFFFRPALKIQM